MVQERRGVDAEVQVESPATVDTAARQTLDWLNQNVWIASVGGVASFAVLTTALWPATSQSGLLAWLVAGVTLALLRVALATRYRRYPSSLPAEAWLHVHRLLTLAAGVHFALASVALFPADDPYRQALIIVFTAGMSACAVNFHALDRPSVELYTVPPALALIWRHLEMGTVVGWGVAGLVVVFTLSMWRAAAATRSAVLRNIALTRSLHHLATHDPLVPLANRTEFMRRLREATARRGAGGIALLFIDLDHFKALNDSLGHAAGDEALVRVGTEIRVLLRASDFAARLGGDEFVVMLEPGDAGIARRVATKLLDGIARLDLAVPGAAGARLGASVGIACSDTRPVDPELLLRCADASCYRAKQAGRGHIVIDALGEVPN